MWVGVCDSSFVWSTFHHHLSSYTSPNPVPAGSVHAKRVCGSKRDTTGSGGEFRSLGLGEYFFCFKPTLIIELPNEEAFVHNSHLAARRRQEGEDAAW